MSGKRIWIPQAVVILMMLWALNPSNPYGYYILLRWVTCAVFIYLTYQATTLDNVKFAWVLGVTAFIYNPIFRVHLNRELWTVINLITIVIAIASIVKIYPISRSAVPPK